MGSITFKNNRIIIPTQQKALKILKWISTSKGKAIPAGGYFSGFSFLPSMMSYCSVSFMEPWAMIGSAIGLKNILKGCWFGVYSSSMKNEMTVWRFPELIGCSMFTLPF